MTIDLAAALAHPAGEQSEIEEWSAIADTFGGRVHVEWDAAEPVTPLIAARALGSRCRHDDQAAVRHAGRRRRGLQPAQAGSTVALLSHVHDVDAAPGAERRG